MCKTLVVGSGPSASTEQHARDDRERGSQDREGGSQDRESGDAEPEHEDGAYGAGAESRDQDRAGAACGRGAAATATATAHHDPAPPRGCSPSVLPLTSARGSAFMRSSWSGGGREQPGSEAQRLDHRQAWRPGVGDIVDGHGGPESVGRGRHQLAGAVERGVAPQAGGRWRRRRRASPPPGCRRSPPPARYPPRPEPDSRRCTPRQAPAARPHRPTRAAGG